MHASGAGGGTSGRVRLGSVGGECGRASGCSDRDRDRRSRVVRGLRPADRAEGAGTCEPVLDRADPSESSGRVGVDRARHARAARLGMHRLRSVEHGDRGRLRCHSARPGRRDVLRRHRGADHARRARGLRRDARAVGAKRRSNRSLTAVRRRARRVCDRGRCSRGRARGALSRAGARRADLCRADRLRHLLGCESRLRSRPERREPRACACGWPSRMPASLPRTLAM